MKEVFITGGLGNQMFQYAFLLSLRERGILAKPNTFMYKVADTHQGYELAKVFGIEEDLSNKYPVWIYRLLYKYHPRGVVFCDKIMEYSLDAYETKSLLYRGYWMQEEYFRDIAEKVRTIFQFKNIDEYNREIAEELKTNNTVSLHIRRGDYLKNPIYSVCTEKYYVDAINHIKSNINTPVFCIFSDDIDWCKIFAEKMNIKYMLISHNRAAESFKDMYLMSCCHHHIIANSSFSWWGAWLDDKKDSIVVSPKRWWTNKDKIINVSNWIYL